MSSLFIQKNISVGASGALFGLLGSMLSELITNWTIYTNKVKKMVMFNLVVYSHRVHFHVGWYTACLFTLPYRLQLLLLFWSSLSLTLALEFCHALIILRTLVDLSPDSSSDLCSCPVLNSDGWSSWIFLPVLMPMSSPNSRPTNMCYGFFQWLCWLLGKFLSPIRRDFHFFSMNWNSWTKSNFVIQVYSCIGDAVPRREWKWALPLVSLPQLYSHI